MVEVLSLGDEEGSDSPCTARPPLECLLQQKQVAPPLEQDTSDIAIVDLRATLDHTIDPAQAAAALERARIALLGKAADAEDAKHYVSSTLHEFYVAQGTALAREARGP
jgi:hypothetical protein